MGSRLARRQGSPQEVGNIFDNFAIDFTYDNGVHMLSMCRHIEGTAGDVSEAVVGSKGTLLTRDKRNYEITGEKTWSFPNRKDNAPYVQEHTDLIEAIRGNKPYNELKGVAESTMTAILGRMAVYTGKEVSYEKALNSQENTFPDRLSWDMSITVPPVAMPGKTPLV
jgi:hypothetical protein